MILGTSNHKASSHQRTRPDCFVYLQCPGSENWVTVGAYWQSPARQELNQISGRFRYAPSYLDAGYSWSIDPVNLPILGPEPIVASRYQGLHDVLRDASPDSWGQALLESSQKVNRGSHPFKYLFAADNNDRWGALAVGSSKEPPAAILNSPRVPDLHALTLELKAIANDLPAVDPVLRKRLSKTTSLGGARPKAAIRDTEGRFWLVKPGVDRDSANIPILEHFAQSLGRASGLNFAQTEYEEFGENSRIVRVLRFDRVHKLRQMCLSAATLLEVEYPGAGAYSHPTRRWSYPRLAEKLRLIGVPKADTKELFFRMVFNTLIGNDDDHVRNHAVVYDHVCQSWRLSPAYDVVPNPDDRPTLLALELSSQSRVIGRANVLESAVRFGFESMDVAAFQLDQFLVEVFAKFKEVKAVLPLAWQHEMQSRLDENIKKLG